MQATWLRGALAAEQLDLLDGANAAIARPGARMMLNQALRKALEPVDALIAQDDPQMRPVRAVAFDKTAQQLWTLPWHQDRVIAVKARQAVPGFENWTQKQGIWHCEPPLDVLTNMLFVRVHLDDCTAQSGTMEMAVGSHAAGSVSMQEAETIAARYPAEVCTARRGDILVLPMLTLHRSLAAPTPTSRRVFRVDYAATPLPAPLAWAN